MGEKEERALTYSLTLNVFQNNSVIYDITLLNSDLTHSDGYPADTNDKWHRNTVFVFKYLVVQ